MEDIHESMLWSDTCAFRVIKTTVLIPKNIIIQVCTEARSSCILTKVASKSHKIIPPIKIRYWKVFSKGSDFRYRFLCFQRWTFLKVLILLVKILQRWCKFLCLSKIFFDLMSINYFWTKICWFSNKNWPNFGRFW